MMIHFIILALFFNLSWATSYVPLKLEQKVARSSIIVIGEVLALSCIDEKMRPIQPEKRCTAPGEKNKLWYKFQVKKILKDPKNILKNEKLPKTISFNFTSMAHSQVPKDNYKSAIGLKRILFLNYANEKFKPFHAAFYFNDLNKEPEVSQLIERSKKSLNIDRPKKETE